MWTGAQRHTLGRRQGTHGGQPSVQYGARRRTDDEVCVFGGGPHLEEECRLGLEEAIMWGVTPPEAHNYTLPSVPLRTRFVR